MRNKTGAFMVGVAGQQLLGEEGYCYGVGEVNSIKAVEIEMLQGISVTNSGLDENFDKGITVGSSVYKV